MSVDKFFKEFFYFFINYIPLCRELFFKQAMLNIVLFGAPGCGKGTQSELLENKYSLEHISTGEIIRNEINAGTELGLQMKDYIAKGCLAPDEIVLNMVENYLQKHIGGPGTIFDGFPRTENQAVQFDKILEKHSEKIDLMIYMDVPEEELVKRILLRGKTSGRADDQSEETIQNRIQIYNAQTAVVAEYYRAQGKYESVDSLGTVEEVFQRICSVIEKHL